MYHTPVLQQQQIAAVLACVVWSVLLGGGAVQACSRSSNTKATMTLDIMALHIGHAGHGTNASE